MMKTLFDSARHETLRELAWNEDRARAAIAHVVVDCEKRFTRERYWPMHPRDASDEDDLEQPATPLYHGACSVFWALRYLQALGAVRLSRSYVDELDLLLARNRAWLDSAGGQERASYLMGDLPIKMLAFGANPSAQLEQELDALISSNLDHPARELMWGSPGTLLAALFLHRHTRQAGWADLFRRTASQLWSQLRRSAQYDCSYWSQDLYGRTTTYLGAVHGFVGTAAALIPGFHLLDAESRSDWERCIVDTIIRTASFNDDPANWRIQLDAAVGGSQPMLMQFCHGAPGFVVCLADLPSPSLDAVLLAAGELIWDAGPLIKGSNLCHGTGGNGYAFLKLFRRTGDRVWLDRARAFAMHGIEQMHEDETRHGQLRYSLWTGDLGFAIYLWDCLNERAEFPTLDLFYADEGATLGARNG